MQAFRLPLIETEDGVGRETVGYMLYVSPQAAHVDLMNKFAALPNNFASAESYVGPIGGWDTGFTHAATVTPIEIPGFSGMAARLKVWGSFKTINQDQLRTAESMQVAGKPIVVFQRKEETGKPIKLDFGSAAKENASGPSVARYVDALTAISTFIRSHTHQPRN